MKEDDQLPAALQHFKRLVDARGCDLGCDAGIRTFLLVSHFFVRSSHSGTLAYIQEVSETGKSAQQARKKSRYQSVPRQAHRRLRGRKQRVRYGRYVGD